MDFDWKSVVGTVAPTIATALGGPLAGVAVSSLAAAFGLSPDADEKQVAQCVQKASFEQLTELKKVDSDFKAKMAELEVDLVRISVEDKKDARQREIDSDDSSTPRVLAIINVVGNLLVSAAIFYAMALYMNGTLSEIKVPEFLVALIGGVVSNIYSSSKQVMEYYFGSSSSSNSQNRLLYHSTPINTISKK
jgi:hypothetical protein